MGRTAGKAQELERVSIRIPELDRRHAARRGRQRHRTVRLIGVAPAARRAPRAAASSVTSARCWKQQSRPRRRRRVRPAGTLEGIELDPARPELID